MTSQLRELAQVMLLPAGPNVPTLISSMWFARADGQGYLWLITRGLN
jgi:hypothetical protein